MSRHLVAMVLLLPLAAHAGGAMSINALRGRAVTDPHGVIVDVRQRLDRGGANLAPADERALLWGMGTAAINADDEAAFAESTLRLDSLGHARGDAVALAASGFLRARHDVANGIGDGLGEALRAAARVQGSGDAQIVAWARFQLCDAYALDESATKALALCRRAEESYRAVGDAWGIADAENDEGIALATLGRTRESAAVYQRSRRRFAGLGATELAVMVGDNLSKMYLKLARPRKALSLSRTSLAHELAAGRISDSLDSSTDIARAEAELGHPRQAYAMMQATVARARAAGIDGQLVDLLRSESELAERAGHMRDAVAQLREALKRTAATSTPALRAIEAELEARYAVREKELRIHDLERENRIKGLALQAARAEARQREEARRRDVLVGRVTGGALAGLLLVAVLLFLLLRAQRRHAAELRLQALRDPLTGIDNRRAFLQHAGALLPLRGDAPAPVLMLIDVDHFKRINDSAGHPQGDRVLVQVSTLLCEAVGTHGRVSRIGGEEFAVLCPTLGAEAGMRLAETLRAGVAGLPLSSKVGPERVTVSIGVAVFDALRHLDLDGWMRAADAALYAAKSSGRDQAVAAARMD
ncbi:GGDEF domain-containing protein [Dyella lutea]|uniref:diguanylate cyclase n=1 Tax=Dyella lutea TaxID=2950441 RepID=A0ABT1FCU5_9GAMM|nr:GGDEF domain-containing protein [Dyella lutea]MCP1373893.1 GGDEF domain-containing protein [Dyella lutea]